jgi:hypothetical protein
MNCALRRSFGGMRSFEFDLTEAVGSSCSGVGGQF